ncbi:MAG: pirin family protein [Candidatus Competibacteraceae bacterium]|jgi:redox-sensitive bicupin YhaK (pirin superfamily)|nr:pirin family protein [Candidatus Competibacteraceae bacterium]
MSAKIELVIQPQNHDLGGFEVRRVLPSGRRAMVGPFIFFDHLGPAVFDPGKGVDVRPHPHIGLATVTYLFEGELLHRDSLGFVQTIRPGDVNWMTAGSGITHSERTGPEERAKLARLHALQIWIALPKAAEETEPSFHHHPASALPLIEQDGVQMRLIAGAAFGQRSPVKTFSAMFYLDVQVPAGRSVALSADLGERAVYVVDGAVEIDNQHFETGKMIVLQPGVEGKIYAAKAARIMLLGGESLEGQRHIWWNFVSSSKERIEQAKADWSAGRFAPVPGETEFIPLPEQ